MIVSDDTTLREYITKYMENAINDNIHRFSTIFGFDESLLRTMISLHLNETNLNEFGRFDTLISAVDKKKAKQYFEEHEGVKLSPPKVNIRISNFTKEFVLKGGFEIE